MPLYVFWIGVRASDYCAELYWFGPMLVQRPSALPPSSKSIPYPEKGPRGSKGATSPLYRKILDQGRDLAINIFPTFGTQLSLFYYGVRKQLVIPSDEPRAKSGTSLVRYLSCPRSYWVWLELDFILIITRWGKPLTLLQGGHYCASPANVFPALVPGTGFNFPFFTYECVLYTNEWFS